MRGEAVVDDLMSGEGFGYSNLERVALCAVHSGATVGVP